MIRIVGHDSRDSETFIVRLADDDLAIFIEKRRGSGKVDDSASARRAFRAFGLVGGARTSGS